MTFMILQDFYKEPTRVGFQSKGRWFGCTDDYQRGGDGLGVLMPFKGEEVVWAY